METGDLGDKIAYVKSMLAMMTGEMERGAMPSQSLAELQGTVDSVRSTAWSLITANADYRGCLAVFRLRRTTEACKRVGVFILTHPEKSGPEHVQGLTSTLRDLKQAMEVARRLGGGAAAEVA